VKKKRAIRDLEINGEKVLARSIWKLAKNYYDARSDELILVYGEAQSRNLGKDDISSVVKAAVKEKVETLLVKSHAF
jgi:hypothetical protein